MSDKARLRKRLRRNRLLEVLEKTNRISLAEDATRLETLRETKSELEKNWQDRPDIRFMDLRLSHLHTLQQQLHDQSKNVDEKNRRASLLNARLEESRNEIAAMEARMQQDSEVDQIMDRFTRNVQPNTPATRKFLVR